MKNILILFISLWLLMSCRQTAKTDSDNLTDTTDSTSAGRGTLKGTAYLASLEFVNDYATINRSLFWLEGARGQRIQLDPNFAALI